MGIFDIFKRRKTQADDEVQKHTTSVDNPVQYCEILRFNKEFAELLKRDAYIARSDYKHLINAYQNIYQFYISVVNAHILKEYAGKNGLDISQIQSFLTHYEQIQDLSKESETIKKHNAQFVASHIQSEKEYLDNILKACDPAILLDNEQREVVLSEEDNTLVITTYIWEPRKRR